MTMVKKKTLFKLVHIRSYRNQLAGNMMTTCARAFMTLHDGRTVLLSPKPQSMSPNYPKNVGHSVRPISLSKIERIKFRSTRSVKNVLGISYISNATHSITFFFFHFSPSNIFPIIIFANFPANQKRVGEQGQQELLEEQKASREK